MTALEKLLAELIRVESDTDDELFWINVADSDTLWINVADSDTLCAHTFKSKREAAREAKRVRGVFAAHLHPEALVAMAVEALGPERVRELAFPRRCPVFATPCPEHGFVHGAEAEELRAGLESLIAHSDKKVRAAELQALLDRVDARDSLARLEACDDEPKEGPST